MSSRIINIIFLAITIGLTAYFIAAEKIHYGGDIIEYFGMTESIINHQSLDLTSNDKQNLIARLGAGYFDNPEYYITATNGKQYAVHFPVYSIVNVPVRLALRLFDIDEYKTFRITNLLILSLITFVILKKYLNSAFKKVGFLILVYLSPVVWYLIWPGPEVFSISLILLSLFMYFDSKNRYKFLPILIAIIASYQSQPLIFIPFAMLTVYFIGAAKKIVNIVKLEDVNKPGNYFRGIRFNSSLENIKGLLKAIIGFVLLFVPNIYYFLTFGTFSSYSKLSGVGLANASITKFIELFFDLNIGLFFYAPFILLIGGYFLIGNIKNSTNSRIVLLGILITCIFYLTNTNWNNGTAGFGPTRYVLPVLPFLIYFYIVNLSYKTRHVIGLIFIVVSQFLILSFNGFLMPELENTVRHSPYANFVLANYPGLYNPTPEIFVERTANKEGGYWDTTIYKANGECKKAYALINKTDMLVDQCGDIPEKYKPELENEFLKKASFPRSLYTTEATMYPADEACAWDYQKREDKPFVCMKTLEDVVSYTGVADTGRFIDIPESFGAWKLKWGNPETMTIPPGYVVNYYSFSGSYVNY